VIVMGALAVRYILTRPEKVALTEAQAEHLTERLEERWHHPRAFLLGFGMTITNVLLAVLWATLGAFLFAHGWVRPEAISRAGCILGVLVGQLTWFFLLTTFVARAHRHITPRTITLLVRICGVVLLLMTVFLAWRMFAGTTYWPGRAPA
jgi:threonine/homoserine/homoserine lactone efflux protein